MPLFKTGLGLVKAVTDDLNIFDGLTHRFVGRQDIEKTQFVTVSPELMGRNQTF